MNELVLANRAADWRRLKMLALAARSRNPAIREGLANAMWW